LGWVQKSSFTGEKLRQRRERKKRGSPKEDLVQGERRRVGGTRLHDELKVAGRYRRREGREGVKRVVVKGVVSESGQTSREMKNLGGERSFRIYKDSQGMERTGSGGARRGRQKHLW